MGARLTRKLLEAMEGAVAAMLAGGDHEGLGDWPEGVSIEDMQAAEDWIADQLRWRNRRRPDQTGEGE